MKETHIPNLNVDPVGIRLERIIEEKKAANEEALGKIKSLTDSWEELNKTVEGDIKDEFEVMDLENQALVEALGDLKRNSTKPDKTAFTIMGKIFSERERIGLPNVSIRVLRRIGRKTSPLDNAITDNLGNFVFRLGKDTFTDDNRTKLDLEYQVYSSNGTLLLSELKSISPRLGGTLQVMLAVTETDVVSNQLEAGKAVKDSIVDSRKLINARVENMRSSHGALAKMSSITREELDSLYGALAVPPPEFGNVISRPVSPTPLELSEIEDKSVPAIKEKPKRPDGRPKGKIKQKQKPGLSKKKPVTTVPGLEGINGIGLQRIKKLRQANINDTKAFIAADNQMLTEILGGLDFKVMKEDARVLLKKK